MGAVFRSPLSSIWRRIRRAEYLGGREPVDIMRLVSPLRYDVMVRLAFFEQTAARERLVREDFERFLEEVASGPYRQWFERVYCVRFHPELIGRPGRAADAFRERVRRSVALYDSFRKQGFETRTPITLRSGRTIGPSDSGKRVAADLFVGDGCHRLALLLLSGATHLNPEQYRVKIKPSYTPIDNTLLLLPALGLDERRYAAFVSHAFGTVVHESLAALERDVATRAPERLPELRAILARDLPHLNTDREREGRCPAAKERRSQNDLIGLPRRD